MRRENISQFCQVKLFEHGKSDVCFNVDVSEFKRENLHDCIQKISKELFVQRPATEPYAQALTMFGSYLHYNLQEEPWYHVEIVMEAMIDALMITDFNPPNNVFDKFKIFVNSIYRYLPLW